MSDTNQDQEQFEVKLASAGETLVKLAAARGLDLRDFTEEETVDLLSTIMGDGGGSGGDVSADVAPKIASAAPVQAATAGGPRDSAQEKVAYTVALAEVMKVAQANGYDLNTASPDELHAAVESMQSIMADPGYGQKQAALQEKVAEADALGRVMAHAYVDELSKIASASAPADDKSEKKAALVREIRKHAGEMPPQFMKNKGKGGDGDNDDADDKKEKEKEEEEKKASFAKQAGLRAAEVLIENGIDPETGAKFASEADAIEAGAKLILQRSGY